MKNKSYFKEAYSNFILIKGNPSELSLRDNFQMIVPRKEATKEKLANLYVTEIVFSSAFQKSKFERQSEAEKIGH